MRPAFIASLLTLLLAACGQTGPLYLPEATPTTTPQTSSPEPVAP